MQVNDELIDKLSRLAMLEFEAEEREQIKKDLEKMIAFVDKLKELDTTAVEPLLHMSTEHSALRGDEPQEMLLREDALKGAPLHDGQFIKVPKMIRKD